MLVFGILFLILVFIVVATARFKMHPFIVLIIAAVIMGFALGLRVDKIITGLTAGFGKTLGSIGIIIAFGAIIGVFLEKSRATTVLAEAILNIVGIKRSALAMNITGFIISIPVFCDSGFIILSSLNKAISKKTGISLVALAIALATGLYATHVFVPPTPGPLAAAALLDADLGMVMLLGIAVAIPVSLAGYFWASYIGGKIRLTPEQDFREEGQPDSLPGLGASLAPILVPILLIALKSVADYPTHPFGEGFILQLLDFAGNPVTALFVGIVLAFGLCKGSGKERYEWISKGLKDAGVILLITGAGGSFGYILRVGGIGGIIGSGLSGFHAGLFLPFVVAAVLKSAQGSSTVAIITTAAIVAPLLGALGLDTSWGKVLAVLATGAGAMTVSHLNDSYFWVVSQFTGMNVRTALRSHTMATLFQGLVAVLVIWLFSLILH